MSFCQYCFDCYKANEKCDYCSQVYFSKRDDGEVDGQMWMCCDLCEKWNHPDCEIEYGTDEVYKAAAILLKSEANEEAQRRDSLADQANDPGSK